MGSTDCSHPFIASLTLHRRQGDVTSWECEDCQLGFAPVSPVEAPTGRDMTVEVRRALALPDDAPEVTVVNGIKALTHKAALAAGAFPCRLAGEGHDTYVHQHDGVWYLPFDPNYVEALN